MAQKQPDVLGHNLLEMVLLIAAQWGIFFSVLVIMLVTRFDCGQPNTCNSNAALLAILAVPTLFISSLVQLVIAWRIKYKLVFLPSHRFVLYGLASLAPILLIALRFFFDFT